MTRHAPTISSVTTIAVAILCVGVLAGCGAQSHATTTKDQAATRSSALPSSADPQAVIRETRRLWTAPQSTNVARTTDTSPRMRAARLLIAARPRTIIPNQHAAQQLLGHPSAMSANGTWFYLLSTRRPNDDVCRRQLRVQFLPDGRYAGMTQDENETCRSGHNPPA